MTDSPLRDRLREATGGRYTVDEELGRGGMAVVFAGTDVRLKRAVAIKALPPELAFRADVRSRFLREAQMAAGLSHPNIVPIYAVEEVDGLVWMVMGRVHGESLAQRLHRDGRLAFGDARRILRETADALGHAHAHGVIHRDVKPDNILLDEKTGRVQVTDFGIARALEADSRLTVTGVAVGTPTYMSPEQARGDDDVDGRADVYALGVVGFQMLAGEPPFIAPNTQALLLKHVSEPPPPISSRCRDIPAALGYAIDRALLKDRRDRWPTATSMRDALDENAAPPSQRLGEWRLPSQAPSPPPESAGRAVVPPALPPYPVWMGGSREDRSRWREAQRAWREQVREQHRAWAEQVRDNVLDNVRDRVIVGVSMRGRKMARRNAPIGERIRSFQRHFVSNAFLVLLLFVINAATSHFPWFLFPAMAMAIGVAVRALSLWQDGVSIGDLFKRPSSFPSAPVAHGANAVVAASDIDARALQLVGPDVLAGAHGAVVRRAADDERAALDTVRSLSAPDRAQLPDVEPTVRSLIERVASLAQALHRLDADVRPEQVVQLDGRLRDARALPDGSADKERRVSLLERQQSALAELSERRATLAAQLESAALVLHTMRLDLLRLRSAGIGAAGADVTSVTQEARALSIDIGRVLDAAAEARRL